MESVSTGILTLAGYLSSFILSFTISRLFLAAFLIPLYLYKLTLRMIPDLLRNWTYLLNPSGWAHLTKSTDDYRSKSDTIAHSQLDGGYTFRPNDILHIKKDTPGWMDSAPFAADTHEFQVCGATARYIHLRASYSSVLQDGRRTHRPIVFLHGNPSWSYMWRNVFPSLLERGHDVYAIDWLGHGRSDKILDKQAISFELHVRTLRTFFEVTDASGCILAAHDWGGTIAMCTIPHLPAGTVESLFLINTFFPSRFSDTSLHYRLLNRIWFCSTGLLGGFLPEGMIHRYLSPHLSAEEIKNYTAPYSGLPRASKASVLKFSHTAPSLPRVLLFKIRQTTPWKVLEGLLGPQHFDTLNTQARLSAQGDQVRRYWGSQREGDDTKVAVVFGDKDPLVKDYKTVLAQTIHPNRLAKWAPRGHWIRGTGHMPMEGKPGEVAGLIARFARGEAK
ncbi:Alpha/Beta hydrolase protein [Aspergillus unguis]